MRVPTDANIVPLSDAGWTVVLVVTIVLAVAWVVGVAVFTRMRYVRSQRPEPVDAQAPHEPTKATRLTVRGVLFVAVSLAVVTLVVFLLGRAGDLFG